MEGNSGSTKVDRIPVLSTRVNILQRSELPMRDRSGHRHISVLPVLLVVAILATPTPHAHAQSPEELVSLGKALYYAGSLGDAEARLSGLLDSCASQDASPTVCQEALWYLMQTRLALAELARFEGDQDANTYLQRAQEVADALIARFPDFEPSESMQGRARSAELLQESRARLLVSVRFICGTPCRVFTASGGQDVFLGSSDSSGVLRANVARTQSHAFSALLRCGISGESTVWEEWRDVPAFELAEVSHYDVRFELPEGERCGADAEHSRMKKLAFAASAALLFIVMSWVVQ